MGKCTDEDVFIFILVSQPVDDVRKTLERRCMDDLFSRNRPDTVIKQSRMKLQMNVNFMRKRIALDYKHTNIGLLIEVKINLSLGALTFSWVRGDLQGKGADRKLGPLLRTYPDGT